MITIEQEFMNLHLRQRCTLAAAIKTAIVWVLMEDLPSKGSRRWLESPNYVRSLLGIAIVWVLIKDLTSKGGWRWLEPSNCVAQCATFNAGVP